MTDAEIPVAFWPLADLPVSDDPVPETARIPFDAPIDCIDEFRRAPFDCPTTPSHDAP